MATTKYASASAGEGGGLAPSYHPAVNGPAAVKAAPVGVGASPTPYVYGNPPTSQPGATAPASGPAAAPALSLHADTNAALTALNDRYTQNLNNLQDGNGQIMDIAGSKIRDAREGGRRALQEGNIQAGKASDPSLAGYDAETQRGVEGAITDLALGQEDKYTSAIQGGVNVAGAAPGLALSEKQLQLSAYNAENAADRNNFDKFLALLNANRQSPIYQGA